jgi:hypothetical protein
MNDILIKDKKHLLMVVRASRLFDEDANNGLLHNLL